MTRTPPRPGQFRRNVLTGVLCQACGILIALVATPILIRGLGEADYGLWMVISALGSWVGFVNLIFSTSAIRFIGQALGSGNESEARQAHAALGRWAFLFALIGAAVVAGLAPWLPRHALNLESQHISLAITALLAQAVFIFFQIQASVGSGVVGAHQRLDISYGLFLAGSALQSGGAAGLAWLGWGLGAVVWWIACVQAVLWLAFSWWAHRLQPSPLPEQGRIDLLGWGRRLFGYGGLMFVGCAAAQLFAPTSRILVGAFRPLADAAYFSVPATLASNLGALSNHIAFSVMPAASERAGQGNVEGLRGLYCRSLRWSWLALVPLAGLALALGSPFVGSWIHPEFGERVKPLIGPLVVGLGFYVLGGVPASVAQGMGRPGPWAAMTLGAGAVNAVLGLLWIPSRGLQGAADAIGIAGTLSLLGLCAWACRALRIGWVQHARVFDVRILIATALVAWGIHWCAARTVLSFGQVIILGLEGIALIGLAAPWWLPREERVWMAQQWQVLRGRMSILR